MRWGAELFEAAVIHVHTPDKVDVVYDIDGSVGIFLTAKDHGLKLLDEEKRGGSTSSLLSASKSSPNGLASSSRASKGEVVMQYEPSRAGLSL